MSHFHLIGNEPVKFDHKTGTLFFEYGYGPIQKFKLTSWTRWLELFTWCDHWCRCYEEPHIVLIASDKRNLVNHDLGLFTASIPENVLDIAARFQYGQLTILRTLRNYPEALDLAQNSPLIFWLLAGRYFNSEVFKQDDWFIQLRARKGAILKFLGYPTSKSTLKVLKKIRVERYTEQDMELIQKLLRSRVLMRHVCHFPVITRTHLLYAVKYPALMKCDFVWKRLVKNELQGISDIDLCHSLYSDCLKAGKMIGIKGLYRRIKTKRTIYSLDRMHDTWVRYLFMYEHFEHRRWFEQSIKVLETEFGKDFPAPPMPGQKDIEPILTLPDLLKEGQEMEHCVITRAHNIYKGKRYIYRMYKPERATLEIDLTASPPILKEIRLKQNKLPAQETVRSAKSWLAAYIKNSSRILV